MSTAEPSKGAVVVLVHGAWHGGWCWERVAVRLRAAGCRVFAPTLSGLAERAGELSASTDVDTHCADIRALLERERLSGVILVGHSYGGIVTSMVADRLVKRLSRLVFLDAVILRDGMAWCDAHPEAMRAERIATGRTQGGGIALPVPSAEGFGITDPADRAWVDAQLTPHPFATYLQPIRLAQPFGNGLPRRYIDCTTPPLASLDGMKRALRHAPGWEYLELATGHDAMVTAPDDVARMILA